MGIRGVQGGVRYDGVVGMVSACLILTKKKFVPPIMVSGLAGVGRSCSGGGEKELVLFKLKTLSVLQGMVSDVEELIFAQIPV